MKIFKYTTLVLICEFLLTNCTANFDGTNSNPNKITVESGKLSASAMFEPILYGGTNYLTYISWFWNDELIQHTANTAYTVRQEHRYYIGDSNWTSLWNHIASYGSNIYEMYRLATIQNEPALQAVSKTLYVLWMQNLTDMFGDIPYSQAFQATKGIKKPVFDSQKQVYQEMCSDLETANKIYAKNPYVNSSITSLDGMYGFDMGKWRKFNNSLYLRLLCRISGRPTTMIDSTYTVLEKMQQIVNNPSEYPIFTSNDDNATVHYSAIDPYYSEFDPKDYTEADFTAYRLTEETIKLMVVKGNDETVDAYIDPRLPIIGNKRPKYTYWKGTVAGCTPEEQNTADKGTSYLNYTTLSRNNSDEFLMDYSEVEFILAEAALNGWISGGEKAAHTYYENAVTASMKKWSGFGTIISNDYTITDDQIKEYLNSPLGSWDDNSNHEQLIINQKYLASFWVGMEGWNEYRRTGYPILTIGAGCTFNDMVLPTRMAYPNTTVATNAINVAAALKDMGGDNDMKTPLWWSKQAIKEGK